MVRFPREEIREYQRVAVDGFGTWLQVVTDSYIRARLRELMDRVRADRRTRAYFDPEILATW